MKRVGHRTAQTVMFVCGLLILSACEPQSPTPTTSPATAIESSAPTTASTSPPTEIAPQPTLEPQVILLRGVAGCESEQDIVADNPIQLHYGVWGSVGEEYAEASWELMDITLTIDGEEIEGEKQPVSPDLVEHCGSDAEDIYWMFYIANLDGLSQGVHQIEVTYLANDVIDDGTGQTHGPGTLFTHAFTLTATPMAAEAGSGASTFSVPDVERLPNNPIIIPEMLPGDDGENINGPSLVHVPTWVEGALGEYYLYFAHHIGSNIRLAYADDLSGPWQLYDGGTLQLEDTICNDIQGSIYLDYKHLASPDVHIDDEAELFRMYFHCPIYISGPIENDDSYMQVTLLATSSDGLNFEPQSEPLGNAYFRVFQWDGYYYALSMPGVFYRSTDGLTDFEEGPTLFNEDMRHSAVLLRDGKLLVFYSMVGDNPERILMSEIDLLPDWMEWTASEPVTVLEPEFDWEGANLPLEPSYRGTVMGPVRQLRDPAIFVEDGHTYLLYSIAGESGIAIAELIWR
jgi:hypothetical protein